MEILKLKNTLILRMQQTGSISKTKVRRGLHVTEDGNRKINQQKMSVLNHGEKQKENDTQGEIFVKKKKNGRLTLVR